MKKSPILNMVGRALGQAGTEYLFIYVIVFVIAVLAAYLIFSSFSNMSSVLPSKCTFDYGVACTGVVVASNSSNTMIALLATNAQEFPLYNPVLTINQSGTVVNANCSPSYVKPGQAMLCVAKLAQYKPVLAYSSGTPIISAKYCSYGCTNKISESFIGNYSTNTKRMISPKVGLAIKTTNNIAKANQYIGISVGLDLFGYVLPIANPELISSNPSINILYNTQGGGNSFISLSSNGTVGQATVSVSYAGLTSNTTVIFLPIYPKILITNMLSGNLTIINASNGAVKSVSGFSIPQSVAVSSNATLAYVTTPNGIALVNLLNDTILKNIATGGYPSAVVDANAHVYIANSGSNNITIMDEKGNVVKSMRTGIFPSFETASGNQALVFVLNQLSANITAINTTSYSSNSLRLQAMPYAIASNYNGSIIYVTYPILNSVFAIYTKNNSVAWRSSPIFIPFGIAYNSANNRLYVTSIGASSVAVLNATSGAQIGSTNVGFLPTFVSTSIDNNYEYIVNSGSDSLSILNATTNKVVATYMTGLFPTWVASS